MSKTIDERVVEMRFDNSQFEKNVATSMSTLDKLKNSLKFTGIGKGFEDIDRSMRGVDFNPMARGVETVKMKFSALEVMAVTALANITNSAVNTGRRLVSAFTLDPIKTGFQEYETQINAVQTILANTSHKGTTLSQVNDALDELNKYADLTIYNFTEMTRNIGTFTAAGLDLDTSVKGIQGIANLAAISGSTSEQASRAMYQLSQALSAGTVQLMDWNSVVNAGMGGKVFQDAIMKTGKEMGILDQNMIKAYEDGASFRSLLDGSGQYKKGWFTSELLSTTLTKFTKSGVVEYLSDLTGITKENLQSLQDLGETAGYSSNEFKALATQLTKGDEAMLKNVTDTLTMANTAEDAATKVKTFTQLMDTLKEAAQSGWTQTWEILIGDFEEAKELWTTVSDVVSGMLNASAEARNKMLAGWKKMGGRIMIIDAIKASFNGLMGAIKPVGEAFRDIFPPLTAKQLLDVSRKVKDLAQSFEAFTGEHSQQIYDIFHGLFSVFKVGANIITTIITAAGHLALSLSKLVGPVLSAGAAMGNFVSGLAEVINKSTFFNDVVIGMTNILDGIIDRFRTFLNSVGETFKMEGFTKLESVLHSILDLISTIGTKIVDFAKKVGTSLGEAFNNGDITKGLSVLNSGIFAAILLNILNFVKSFTSVKKLTGNLFDGFGKSFSGVTSMLEDVRDTLKSYQESLKAETLLKIGKAIALLAASLFIISSIDPDRLTGACVAMSYSFANLMLAMKYFEMLNPAAVKKTLTMATTMISLASAVLILAGALRMIGSLDIQEVAKGVVGIGALTFILVKTTESLSKIEGKMLAGAANFIAFAIGLKIMASALEDLGNIDWKKLATGLIGLGVLLVEIGVFQKTMAKTPLDLKSSVALIAFAAGVRILASAIAAVAELPLDGINRGLWALGGALTIVTLVVDKLGKSKANMANIGAGLLAASAGIWLISKALSQMGKMKIEEVGKALLLLAGTLTALSIALNLMQGTVGGSAALLLASVALMALVPVIKLLGSMDITQVGTAILALGGSLVVLAGSLIFMTGTLPGSAALLVAAGAIAILAPALRLLGGMDIMSAITALVALGGTLIIMSSAAVALSALLVPMAALAGVLALIGASVFLAGAGLLMLSTAITTLAAAGVAAASSLVASIAVITTGLIKLIPTIVSAIGEAIAEIAESIADNADIIIDSVVTLIVTLLETVRDRLPEILAIVADILIGVVETVVEKVPELINAGIDIVVALIDGLAQGIDENRERINAAIHHLCEAILNGVKDFFGIHSPSTVFADIGMNLILGLIEGIKSQASSAVSAITSLGSSLVSSLKNLLGIHSPSVVMKEIGEFAVDGLVKGLDDKEGRVHHKAQKLADGVMTAKDSLERMEETVEGATTALTEYGYSLYFISDAYAEEKKAIDDSKKAIESYEEARVKNREALRDEMHLADELLLKEIELREDIAEAEQDSSAAGVKRTAELKKQHYEIVKQLDSIDSIKKAEEEILRLQNEKKLKDTDAEKKRSEAANKRISELQAYIDAENDYLEAIEKETAIYKTNVAYLDENKKTLDELIQTRDNYKQNLKDEEANYKKLTEEKIKLESVLAVVQKDSTAAGKEKTKAIKKEIAAIDEQVKASDKAQKKLKENLNSTRKDIMELEDVVEEQTAELTEKMKAFYNELETGISDNISSTLNPMSIKYSSGISNIFEAFKELDEEEKISVTDMLTNMQSQINGVKKWERDLNSLTGKLHDGIISKLRDLGPSAAKELQAFMSMSSSEIEKANKIFEEEQKMTAQSLLDNYIDAADKASKWAQKISEVARAGFDQDLLKEIGEKGIDEGMAFMDALLSMNDTQIAEFNKAREAALVIPDDISKRVILAYEYAGSEAANAYRAALEAGIAVDTKITSGTDDEENTKTTAETLKTIYEGATGSVMDDLKESGNEVGSTLVFGINEGALSGLNTLIETVNEITSKSIEAIKDTYNDFVEIGKYLVQGFARGIDENTFYAEARAAAMANAAYSAAMAALDAHSPSRLFMEVGGYVSQGFAIGIDKFGGMVKKSSTAMADIAINTARNAVGNISKAVSNGMDIRPTITPVINAGSVAAADFNFGVNVGTYISGPIDSLSTLIGNTQTKINESNERVVDAISNLKDDLSAIFDGDDQEIALYVDSKKLATSIAKPMNRQLNILSKRGSY